MKAEKKKLIMTLSVIITLNIFLLALSQYASADLYKKGASGAAVREIQTRLKSWGYYNGSIDGIYGSQTEKAVRYFQKKNGLSVDGQCGNMTLAALGLPTGNSGGSSSGGSSSSGNIDLLARLISAEARGEPYEGQVAVGAVVLNRVDHPSFPNTISGVIYQHEAFTCVYDGQFDQPVAESAYRAARDAINGWDPSYGAIYYFNPATATSAWIWSRPEIVTIGRHKFCA
ncbi:MAG: spore cortex-lytic enzyme [Oscillospiraceae bacterium]|nr:spore cortex-lytic enzyme [Oscillospiraceae bacterium]